MSATILDILRSKGLPIPTVAAQVAGDAQDGGAITAPPLAPSDISPSQASAQDPGMRQGSQPPAIPPAVAAAALKSATSGAAPPPPDITGIVGQPDSAATSDTLNTLVPQPGMGADTRPQLAKPHVGFLGHLKQALPYVGAVGAALEAAGGDMSGANLLEQSIAGQRAAALKQRELEEVEKPKAQAYADYMSGKNETAQAIQQSKNTGAQSVQGLKNTGAQQLQNIKDTGAYQRELLRQGAPMVISPEMATLAEQPDLAGQAISGATLKNFNTALRAHGAGIKDLGTEGLWVVDNTGRKLHQISVSSPSMTRAVAGRQAGVTDVYDENGNLVPMTDAERLQRGLPKAQTEFSQQGPTAATRTAGQAAGAVASHIPAFKQAVDNLAAKGQLGPVMGRLNEFLTKGYGGSDPDVSNLLTTLKLLKSGAVRAHFGARGGAQILSSFDQTLNPAMTPEAIKGSIDAIGNFLNTYGDIGKFQPKRNGAAPSRNAPPAVPKKGDPLGIL